MKRIVLLLCSVFLLAGVATAAELKVEQGAITTQVTNRTPVDDVKSTSAAVGKLFCFTKVTGADADTSVTHVWYHAGKEMNRVTLAVKGASWRVWSSKSIQPELKGEWKVDVLDAAGKVLTSIPFTVN